METENWVRVEDLKAGMFVESYPYRLVTGVGRLGNVVVVETQSATGATKTQQWYAGVKIDLAEGWD